MLGRAAASRKSPTASRVVHRAWARNRKFTSAAWYPSPSSFFVPAVASRTTGMRLAGGLERVRLSQAMNSQSIVRLPRHLRPGSKLQPLVQKKLAVGLAGNYATTIQFKKIV